MSDISNETTHTLTGYLGPEFQLKLMWQLLIEPEFAEKIIPLLSVEYFDDPSMKKMFIIMLQYFKDNEKVSNIPNQSINLAIQKYKSHNDPIEEELLLAIINKIRLWNDRVLNKDLLNDGDVVQRETFLFIKQQEYRKFSEFIQEKVKTGGIKSKNIIVEVEEKIKKIEDIGNDEDFGSQILEEIDDVLKDEFRETIPTGIGFLDEITGGGLGRGETGVILSPSGFGKSSMLTKIANTGVNEGKNILHIVFEDTLSQIKRKHYAIWSKVPLSQFKGRKEDIKEKITTYFNENKPGELIIKRFIEDETTIPQLKQWIIRYQKKFGIKFDEIILDYLDCIECHKKTNDVNESEKLIIKSFMGMIAEFDIPGWTAVQSGRLGFSAEWLEAGHTGGSIKRVQKTHLLLSIAKTQPQRENDLANIKIIKARFAKDGQQIEDCIFNNDTLEIRSTNNNWRTTLKKYDEKDLESIEDKTLKLHAEVSKYDEVYNVTDIKEPIMSNFNFDNENNNEIKKEETISNKNSNTKYGDVDDFIKNLMDGKLDSEDKNMINNLMDNK